MDSTGENKREKNIEWPTTTNGMDRLPREVSLDIISRLPITSLIRFRYTSKSWKSLSYDPQLISMHFSRSAKNTTYMIFRSSDSVDNHLRFLEFSNHNKKQVVRKFQLPFPIQMSKINIVGSCNGLICLSNSKNHEMIQIFNPFTRSYKRLPDSRNFDDQKVLVGFGFHPLTEEYKVVRIVYYHITDRCARRFKCGSHYFYSQSEVQVYTVGSNDWRNIGKIPYQIEPGVSESLFVNGRLHWLTRFDHKGVYSRNIISFDLADEQFREVPSPDWVGIRMQLYPFTVIRDCLSVVVYPRNGNIEIWVMKEYGVKDSWTKDFEINVNDPIPNSTPQAWTASIQISSIRVLCLTKNGGILLMRDGVLFSYDPENRELKDVVFEGIMPKCLQIIVHMGSLLSIENV